jgi:hypothetical protein
MMGYKIYELNLVRHSEKLDRELASIHPFRNMLRVCCVRILEFLCSQVHYNLLFGESMCFHGVYTSFPGFSRKLEFIYCAHLCIKDLCTTFFSPLFTFTPELLFNVVFYFLSHMYA